MKHILKIGLFLAGLFAIVVWFRRNILALVMKLPPVENPVIVTRGVRIPVQGGLMLAADHYSPSEPGSYPTILIRSPYGRNRKASSFGLLLEFYAQRFAERGYHVIVQDVRGRFDSGGVFDPYFNEKDDGLATINWMKRQPWFNGVVGMWGSSYLGIVQWVLAHEAPEVKAITPMITGSDLPSIVFPDDAFDLGLAVRWIRIFDELDHHNGHWLLRLPLFFYDVERSLPAVFAHVPLADDDEVSLGHKAGFYQSWMAHANAHEDFWQEPASDLKTADVTAPAHLIGGWYDFFLRALLADYEALRAAGRNPYLTIGPWHHFNAMVSSVDLREGLTWFNAHLKNRRKHLRTHPVRLYIMGADEWRDMETWPPPSQERAYYLQPMGWLNTQPVAITENCDHYVYDPADPTPAVGGTLFSPSGGPCDNRNLEARPDVLVYTSTPLAHDLEVIGAVRLVLYVRSSREHTDFFGRLCDVQPDGRSINLCDGLFRITPGRGEPQPDGSLRIEVDMWSTAHRFRAGHCIRLQVSSGAHPRWSRNLGTDEPLNTGKTMTSAEQTVYLDADHPSALLLPVTRG